MVKLFNETPMPVTQDLRYVDICAKVNKYNVKIGQAQNLKLRQKDYVKDFGINNIYFEPIAIVEDTKQVERMILRELKHYRKRSPKGAMLEWLEGISFSEAKKVALGVLDSESIIYK